MLLPTPPFLQTTAARCRMKMDQETVRLKMNTIKTTFSDIQLIRLS